MRYIYRLLITVEGSESEERERESLYGTCLSGMGMGTLCLQIVSSHTLYQIQNILVWYYEISIPCVRIEDQYSTNNDKNKYHNNISNRNTSSCSIVNKSSKGRCCSSAAITVTAIVPQVSDTHTKHVLGYTMKRLF